MGVRGQGAGVRLRRCGLLLRDGSDEGLGTIHVDRGYGWPCRASTPHSVIRPASDDPQIPRRVTRAQ
jgi:hypothetical protein